MPTPGGWTGPQARRHLQSRVGISIRRMCFLPNAARGERRRWHGTCSIAFRSPRNPRRRLLASRGRGRGNARRHHMLWTIFVILLVLWLLGMVSSYTLGGFIHILLILAIGMLLINVIQGRRIT